MGIKGYITNEQRREIERTAEKLLLHRIMHNVIIPVQNGVIPVRNDEHFRELIQAQGRLSDA